MMLIEPDPIPGDKVALTKCIDRTASHHNGGKHHGDPTPRRNYRSVIEEFMVTEAWIMELVVGEPVDPGNIASALTRAAKMYGAPVRGRVRKGRIFLVRVD